MSIRQTLWFITSAAFYFLLVAVWQLIANAQWVAPMYLPGPDKVLRALTLSWQTSQLADMIGVTLYHMIVG